MRNYTVGSVTGIPIRFNVTLVVFLPVLAWLLSQPDQLAVYASAIEALSPQPIDVDALQRGRIPIVLGIAAAFGLFVSVLIHELGHSWTARVFDVDIASITLWIFGGMAHMEDLPEDWNVEFWIATAGPVTSLLLAGGFYGVLQVVPASAPVLGFAVGWLAVANLTLAAFNVVPAFPMDGGRILRALLARSRPYVSATETAASIGRGFAMLMAIVGIFALAPFLVLIAMFVYVAATAESRATVVRGLLRDVTIRDLYSEAGDPVNAYATVQELLERGVSRRHASRPVVEAGRLAGIVTFDQAAGVPTNRRDSMHVSTIMSRDPPMLSPDADAFDALRLFSQERADRIAVVDDSRLLGILSEEDVLTALETIQGLDGGSRSELVPDGYA